MAAGLTVIAIDALKPDVKPVEVSDGRIGGLRIVIHPSGRKTWILRYRARNNRTAKKLTIGAFPTVSLKDARERATKALAAVADGGDPAVEKKATREAARTAAEDTVEMLVERFVERYLRPKKRRTWAETKRLLEKEAVGAWKGRPVSSVTRKDVHRLLDGIVDRGAPIAANRVFAAVRKMFAWAVERGDIEVSPCIGIKPPSAEASRERVLDDAEIKAVWRACSEIGGPFSPLVKLLILTGQRRDEVGAMRWAEVDLERRLWTLPAGRVKNGNGHAVPLSRQAVEILAALPRIEGAGFVFTVSGVTAVSGYSRAKLRLDAAMKDDDATIADWRLHDLRRSFASGCARIGIALPTIERALNHVSGSFKGVAGVYQRHDFLAERQAAMDAWARHVEAIVTGTSSNVVELAAVRT